MPQRDVADVLDVPDVRDAPDIVDVRADASDASTCTLDPPSGPPANVGRSCRAMGVPAEHCREVGYCGGRYRMGSTDAWEVRSTVSWTTFSERFTMPIRTCDLHEGVVRGGYVDAYEVTVARFRAWVNAGLPRPAVEQPFFGRVVWNIRSEDDIRQFGTVSANDRVPGMPTTDEMCTWSPTPGVNDNLPMNCVTLASAAAFCWWDGKQIATEVAWEYLATNRGTTPTPFGSVYEDGRGCDYGDVGVAAGVCPRASRPAPVGTHPMGVTRDPPGVHDLWGGLQEYVLGPGSPYSPMRTWPVWSTACIRNALPTIEGDKVATRDAVNGAFMVRGASWFHSLEDHRHFAHARTRGGMPEPTMGANRPRSVRVGIRCMRWVADTP
jgi:formylglycine-generating enzyme required for sulfatase activity